MWLKCIRHPENAIFTQNFAVNATPEVSFSQVTNGEICRKKHGILCKIKSSNRHYQLLKPHMYFFLKLHPKKQQQKMKLRFVLQSISIISLSLFISLCGGHEVSYQNLFNTGLPGWMIIHILSLYINYVHDVRNYPDSAWAWTAWPWQPSKPSSYILVTLLAEPFDTFFFRLQWMHCKHVLLVLLEHRLIILFIV